MRPLVAKYAIYRDSYTLNSNCGSRRLQMIFKIGALKNFWNIDIKTLVLESLLIKKILQHRFFPVNITKYLRTPFSHNTSGRLPLKLEKNDRKKNIDYIDNKLKKRNSICTYILSLNKTRIIRYILNKSVHLKNYLLYFFLLPRG